MSYHTKEYATAAIELLEDYMADVMPTQTDIGVLQSVIRWLEQTPDNDTMERQVVSDVLGEWLRNARADAATATEAKWLAESVLETTQCVRDDAVDAADDAEMQRDALAAVMVVFEAAVDDADGEMDVFNTVREEWHAKQ